VNFDAHDVGTIKRIDRLQVFALIAEFDEFLPDFDSAGHA